MDDDSNTTNSTICDNWALVEAVNIIEKTSGGLGVIACTVALVFAIVSRFYKDIVQRLILYKLITMLIYSLSQFMFPRYDDGSDTYKSFAIAITHISYCVNLVLNFWLTIKLYLCIVHLKEMKNYRKLEPIAIITSCFPLVIAVYIPYTKYDDCTETLQLKFSTEGSNHLSVVFTIGYSIAGLLYFIMSILVTIIFIVTLRRSQLYRRRKHGSQEESLLLATFSNKWKILSKQLLPLVVYPIVNTVMTMVFFPLTVYYYTTKTSIVSIFYTLISTSGIITGFIVILHLSILKRNKKQRERERKERETIGIFCVVPKSYTDSFTRDTVASTNAGTIYQFTRTSSFSDQKISTIN